MGRRIAADVLADACAGRLRVAGAAAVEAGEVVAPLRRKVVHSEAYRQEKAVVWVRDCVVEPHVFMCFDRSAARGQFSHLFLSKRGIRKGTPDTVLFVEGRPPAWFEFKSPGESVKIGDDQDIMLNRLGQIGHRAAWGVTVDDLCSFYEANGVRLSPGSRYRALVLDAMVDSRIAKERAKGPRAKAPMRYKSRLRTPSKRYRELNEEGLV